MQQWSAPDFIPAESLTEAATRIGALTGAAPERTRGEKRALLALRDALGLDIPAVETNSVLGAELAWALGVTWHPDRYVDRTTLTLDGVNALLYGASIAFQEGSLRDLSSRTTPGLTGPEWEQFQPAVSKIEAVTRISALTDSGPEGLGPGSKERKSVLANLATKLLPEIDQHRLSKTRLAEEIARHLDVPWSDDYISTGETIRLNGLNVILAGAERRLSRLGDTYAEGLTPHAEGTALVEALRQKLLRPHERAWDGREKTMWLRNQGTRQENQMEWPGFYFEYRGKEVLNSSFRPSPNPPQVKFGNTVFDYSLNHVWDLKSHTIEQVFPVSRVTRTIDDEVQLNDVDAVRECVSRQGLGFLILSGQGVMDEDGAFKAWHDGFKGRHSTPSLSGRSRMRKAAFIPRSLEAFWIPNLAALDAAVLSGTLAAVRQGRQQSGAVRPRKFSLRLDRARKPLRVADRAW